MNAAIRKKLTIDRNAFSRANGGKVSPDDCEHILSLALEGGVVKPENLQGWADKNLGVDCTGFVVAYYDDIGLIDLDSYNGGASCFTLFNKAKNNKDASLASHLIWELDDVEVDDMILWMNAAQVETRSPGHIAVIYDIDYDLGMLYTAESNGANDGYGHWGPKLTQREWIGPISDSGPAYVQLGLGNADRVVIVRPPANFG